MLPEVSFYVLASQQPAQRQVFACKLIEKIYRSGQVCYVLTDTAEQARELDNQLWTFRPGSFVPHQLYSGTEPAFTQTILIGGLAIPSAWSGVIVNLSTLYPPTVAPTQRILEILDQSASSLEAGRQRYRHYQQVGIEVVTHKIS